MSNALVKTRKKTNAPTVVTLPDIVGRSVNADEVGEVVASMWSLGYELWRDLLDTVSEALCPTSGAPTRWYRYHLLFRRVGLAVGTAH